MRAAAVRIQSFFRMITLRRHFLKEVSRRQRAAAVIQILWRIYRRYTLMPRALKFRKDRAAILVQKYLKGYL